VSEDIAHYCRLGAEHLEKGEPEEALEWYERALSVDPEFADAWCGRGKAYYDLGRLERADRAFRRGLGCARRNMARLGGAPRWWADENTRPYLRALHGRGLCRFWMAHYEEAARLFRRLLRLAPGDPLDVRFLLGETYFRMGEVDRAIREWREVGDDPDALYNLGLAYFYREELTRSVNSFRRGIFENLFLVARITNSEIVPNVPTYEGTHTKGLDHEYAAFDYLDRCGDLWRGRPVLCRWLRGIYEHKLVRDDIRRHVEHLRRLVGTELTPGERARLEGENTALRSEERLRINDAEIARDVFSGLFRIE